MYKNEESNLKKEKEHMWKYVALSVVLGALLGASLSYIVVYNQFLLLQRGLNDAENELALLRFDMQNVNRSVMNNSLFIVAVNSSLSLFQDSVSSYQEETQTYLSLLHHSITNNVDNLQGQIDSLEESLEQEWEFIGMWDYTRGGRTTSFAAGDELLLNLWIDGRTWQSYVFVRIYYDNGTYYNAICVSGYWTGEFALIPLEGSGRYYLVIDVYNINDYAVNVWTKK